MDKTITTGGKKGRVWKWFLFGNRSKPVLPLIKDPWSSLSRKAGPDAANTCPIFGTSWNADGVHEDLVTLNGSNGSMWDALMTGGAALDKRFFHSSLSSVAATASTTPVVTCQWTSNLVAQESDVHRLSPPEILSVCVINVEIFWGVVTKSCTLR